VGLVADHELVRLAVQLLDVAGEPRIRLDRDRVALGGNAVAGDLRRDALAVALVLELSVELGDEQPAVREDQDSVRASRLDETGGGDRLPGGGGVAEPISADRPGVVLR
jgi:hypothetical protein